MTTSTAPGKLILSGEHAVVYGQPAIAVPITSVQATAHIIDRPAPGIVFNAPDIGEVWSVADQPHHPLSHLVQLAAQRRDYVIRRGLDITLSSTIPIAGGMGSGAALGAALVQALGQHWHMPFSAAEVSAMVFESEQAYHGTPSGIDNTVVSWRRPIVFTRTTAGPRIEPLVLGRPLQLVIGDTGMHCPTKITVGRVRQLWQANPQVTEQHIAAIGSIVNQLRSALATGDLPAIGGLLNRNQDQLAALGVSSPKLEQLIMAARNAGAAGAKLSGGGGGGVMLAVAAADRVAQVADAIEVAGARRVLFAELLPQPPSGAEL